MEIWKPIKNYEDSYEISNLGNVKSLNYGNTGTSRLLKLRKDKYGYLNVELNKNGKRKVFKVHRLVLMTFMPIEGMESLQVNHIDENKLNNTLENLEWCTNEYNSNYGTRNDKISKKQKINNSNSKKIYCVELDKTWNTIKECAKELNINYRYLCKILRGEKQTEGYHFKELN